MQKLCTVEIIKMEMELYLPLKEAKERFTNWFIWRDGVYMDWDGIMELTKPESLRLIAQINRNIFYDIDYNKDYIHICKWRVKWDANHRLYWEDVWVKNLRFSSTSCHEKYYSIKGFETHKYLKMVEEINTKITTLQKISKIDTKPHNLEKTKSKEVNLSSTKTWIQEKIY